MRLKKGYREKYKKKDSNLKIYYIDLVGVQVVCK